MRKPTRSKTYATARGGRGPAGEERLELALLEEFARCESVAALARAMAARLGQEAQSEELIEEAGLSASRPRPLTQRD